MSKHFKSTVPGNNHRSHRDDYPQEAEVLPLAQKPTFVDLTQSTNAACADDMEVARLKWFNVEKGFGFVVDKDGKDLFLHANLLKGANIIDKSLQVNQTLFIKRGPGKSAGKEAVVAIRAAA